MQAIIDYKNNEGVLTVDYYDSVQCILTDYKLLKVYKYGDEIVIYNRDDVKNISIVG